MSFYADIILPRLCHLAMRNRALVPYRRRVVGDAEGRVLELGVGSGMNLPFYSAAAREVLALEPSARLIAWAQDAATRATPAVRFIDASAEAIPLESASVDTIVMTWTLCTIPGTSAALAEARRVLAPGGRILFVEHGRAPDAGVRRWQDRLTPAWRRFAGGCHLNRPIAALIEGAGFAMAQLETGYMPGPRVMTFMYEGCAKPV